MSLKGAGGQHVFRENLTRKRRGRGWKRLFGGSDFALHRAGRILAIFDRKKWLASSAFEQIDEPLFSRLCNRFNVLAVTFYSYECRRRGEIAVPEIVFYSLEVPKSLASLGVQSNEAVGKQIVT